MRFHKYRIDPDGQVTRIITHEADRPNGLAINASYFTNIECNINTIVRLLQQKQDAGLGAIEVKPELTQRYNDSLSDRFETYSWGASDCNSYYRTATGHAPFLFPGGYKDYHALHEDCSLEDFRTPE